MPRYKVDSPFVRDREGRVVFFHGVNAVWKRPPYYPPSSLYGAPRAKSYFDERDARWLARNGLNSVRLGSLFVGLESKRDEFDDSYLGRIEAIAQALADENVTVMIDFHQDMYNERFQGEGFPDWAVHTDGAQPESGFGFPGNYFTPGVSRAFDNLWEDTDNLWQEYRDAWRYTAARFKDEPNLIGYDLFNEPWPGTRWESCANPQGCPEFDLRYLQPFMENVIAGIREIDMENVIWWDPHVINNNGTENNVGLESPIADPGDNNGISFHHYCLVGAESTPVRPSQDGSCVVTKRFTFENQKEAALRNGSSLFLTEFGATDDRKELRLTSRAADEHMVSWHYWHYGFWKDPTTTGTGYSQAPFEDDLARFTTMKKDKLRILVRTYPQAVAGTPVSFVYHPNSKKKIFRLVYEADASIDAPTIVYVPVHRHYLDGYEVDIDGPARVVSRPGAMHLVIDAAGDGTVSVRVTKTS